MINAILLDSASASSGSGAAGWGTMLIWLVVMIGIMYFLMIRPQTVDDASHFIRRTYAAAVKNENRLSFAVGRVACARRVIPQKTA